MVKKATTEERNDGLRYVQDAGGPDLGIGFVLALLAILALVLAWPK